MKSMLAYLKMIGNDTRTAMLFLVLPLMVLSTPVSTPSPNYRDCQYDSINMPNYTLNSPFQNNLKHLLETLSLNTPLKKGFYNTSAGNDPDKVYGQALCRGDVTRRDCLNCVKSASQEMMEECQSEDAIVWHEFCQIRYSYEMFFSSMVYTGKYPKSNDQMKNVTDVNPVEFNAALMSFMKNLSNKAAFNPSVLMFATGKIELSRTEAIYGLVQCARDINPTDCRSCLESAVTDLNSCCHNLQGGTVFSRNCNVRFELYRFYNDSTDHQGGRWRIWVVVLVVVAVFALAIFIAYRVRFGQESKGTERDEERSQTVLLRDLASPTGVAISEDGDLVGSQEMPFMDLATIKAATEDFSDSNKLGQGGFGAVYKGVLPSGKDVAIKRLSRKSWQGLAEFKNEVLLIAKLQHRNLVRLVGCGIEGEEKLLLYEYMPNRSLDIFIFDSTRRSQLDWEMCYGIINGIAKGLLYLHEDSRLKIIHRDLKPSNVLLDHDMVAKISDFGMARIFGKNQNSANTRRVVGTYGYMAPEYAMEGLFSVKSDVFSFGVILLEIISGKKNSGFYLTEHAQTLLAYAWRLWNEDRELEFVDPWLTESGSMVEIERCIHVGLLCVQEDPEDRPTMSSVVVLLGSESATLPEPRQPAFAVGRLVQADQSSPSAASLNQVTVSSILPR